MQHEVVTRSRGSWGGIQKLLENLIGVRERRHKRKTPWTYLNMMKGFGGIQRGKLLGRGSHSHSGGWWSELQRGLINQKWSKEGCSFGGKEKGKDLEWGTGTNGQNRS